MVQDLHTGNRYILYTKALLDSAPSFQVNLPPKSHFSLVTMHHPDI